MRRADPTTSPRCLRCQLPPRWCICAAHRAIRCPLQIDVLIHQRERHRPSSTGKLIERLFPEARPHVWGYERQPTAAEIASPDRETWILHPHGAPPPPNPDPRRVQVVLLDGAWSEASTMARAVASWGQLVSLPLSGPSRYWLRSQQDGGRYSTVEALLHVLDHFGLAEQSRELRLQFELHVYAGLRARGRREVAAEFLAGSVLPAAMPTLIAQLQARRPRSD